MAPSKRQAQDFMDLQREYKRVMDGTSSLSDEQQDMVSKDYFRFMRGSLDMAETADRQRRCRRRTGPSNRRADTDLSGFEEITMEEANAIQNSTDHGSNPGPSGPNGSGANTSTEVARPTTVNACLVAMKEFFLWSINYFVDKAVELWNAFYMKAKEFLSCLVEAVCGSRQSRNRRSLTYLTN